MRETIKIKYNKGFSKLNCEGKWLRMVKKENLFQAVEYHLQIIGFAYNLTELVFESFSPGTGNSIYMATFNSLQGDPFGEQAAKPKMELVKAEELKELSSFVSYNLTSCRCCCGAEIIREVERLERSLERLEGKTSRSKIANRRACDYLNYGERFLREVKPRLESEKQKLLIMEQEREGQENFLRVVHLFPDQIY